MTELEVRRTLSAPYATFSFPLAPACWLMCVLLLAFAWHLLPTLSLASAHQWALSRIFALLYQFAHTRPIARHCGCPLMPAWHWLPYA
eukprot:6200578-Pleurochrysis_carterae.AAC.2